MTTAPRPLCIDGTLAHRWLIPNARGVQEDEAVCSRCGAKKMQPISNPLDWPDGGLKRQYVAMTAPLKGDPLVEVKTHVMPTKRNIRVT